jgi:hypothetical protein
MKKLSDIYKKIIVLLMIGLAVLFNGCGTAERSYTSDEKFSESLGGPLQKAATDYDGPYRNPVIIVHGFLGANMLDTKTNKNVWGEFSSQDSYTVSDEKMRALSMSMVRHKPLKDIRDDTVPNKMLNTVIIKFLGMTFTENAYVNLANILRDGGYQLEGMELAPGKNYHNLFQFSYDWRRDIQESAGSLHEYILAKKAQIQKVYKSLYGLDNYDVKFDIIGHSMGGLVARYYLQYGTADLPEEGEAIKCDWAGAKHIDRLIILGTPNAGYLDTLLELQSGMPLPPFPSAMIATWPSIYQMLPAASTKSVVYKHDRNQTVDIYDLRTWIKMKWALANPEQYKVFKILLPEVKDPVERRLIAFDHLKKCLARAKRFKRAMGYYSKPPPGVKLYLVLGNAVKTTRKATVDATSGEIEVIEYGPGDGKVLASSAMYDRREGAEIASPFLCSPIVWDSIIQLRAAHMGITSHPSFKDNILFLLSAVAPYRYNKLIEQYWRTNKVP